MGADAPPLFGEAPLPSMPSTYRAPGAPTKRDLDRDSDQRRGSARARGYDSRWDKAAAAFLRAHPLCEYCEAGAFDEPCTTAAGLVDHLFPHKGDRALFWASKWWVACCAACHNGPKQRVERRGLGELNTLAEIMGRPMFCEVLP